IKRIRKIHCETFVRLKIRVAVYGHADGLRQIAGIERQRAVDRDIVGLGRSRYVRGGEVRGDDQIARRRKSNGEVKRLGAGVAFNYRDIVYRERRPSSHYLAAGERAVTRREVESAVSVGGRNLVRADGQD